jgi:hypothetical protein
MRVERQIGVVADAHALQLGANWGVVDISDHRDRGVLVECPPQALRRTIGWEAGAV